MQNLYYGGDIITMVTEDDSPEAVLVTDGIITFAGPLREAEVLARADAGRVDLKGKTLMPSFIDPHSHISMYSQYSTFADLSQSGSFDDIVTELRRYRDEKGIDRNGIIMAFGYDHNFLKEGKHPDKTVLDRVSPDIPILILHSSGHMAAANTAMLALAGIPEHAADPSGGHYGRDEDGNLNGYLEEMSAITPVLRKIYPMIMSDPGAQMRKVQEIYLKYGVTTAQDGAMGKDGVEDFLKFADSGILKLDVVAYITMEEDGIKKVLEKYPQAALKYHNRFKVAGGKIFLDGSPQGKTAWLTKPYEGDTDYCGYPALSEETVEKNTGQAVDGGYQLLAHCNGDAAADRYLKCYEKALRRPGADQADLRPVMIHCQTVRDDQLKKMEELHMIPSIFAAHIFYWGDVHLKNLGPVRGAHISPARSALEFGLKYNFHQDCPVLPPDMMQTVWCVVNRVTRKGVKLGEEQCIGVFDALKGITINAAYAYHEEHRKGTIEEGKLADLIILEKNPLKAEKMELKDIAVLETIKEGETLYKKESQ